MIGRLIREAFAPPEKYFLLVREAAGQKTYCSYASIAELHWTDVRSRGLLFTTSEANDVMDQHGGHLMFTIEPFDQTRRER